MDEFTTKNKNNFKLVKQRNGDFRIKKNDKVVWMGSLKYVAEEMFEKLKVNLKVQ